MAFIVATAHVPARVLAQQSAAPTRTPDVGWVPTSMEVVDAMLALARLGQDDVVYDLGSGDGRIVIGAAKRFGARGVGIDIDPALISESRRNADTAGVAGRVEFRQADLFQTDLRPANVVTLYLAPGLNVKLRSKLLAELKPGTRVISHAFDMDEWQPDSTLYIDGRPIYFWVLPADVAGAWDVAVASNDTKRRYRVRLDQRFQLVGGTAMAGARRLRLAEARLVGDRISFTLTDTVAGRPVAMRFSGRVSGAAAAGTVATGENAGSRTWSATRVPSGRTGAQRRAVTTRL